MKQVIDLNGNTIEVADNTPVKTVNGVHYLLTPEDEAEIAAREAVWEAASNDRQLGNIRAKRKPMLEEADILINIAVDNGQNTTALRAYRQSLRDITSQQDIYSPVWPTKP